MSSNSPDPARPARHEALAAFQEISGVGPSLGRDLLDLGFRRLEEIAAADPERMYRRLARLRGRHIDRCVLYVFRCAVYFSSRQRHDPRLLKWWNWKD